MLEFIRYTERRSKSRDKIALYKCLECGKEKEIIMKDVKSGHTKSCGCLKTKHGMTNSSIYSCYRSMIKRCCNKKDKGYKRYGKRGITVCDRWLASFENFYKDMGDKPGDEYSIERIDNNGHYCKENCKWGTKTEQANNRRSSHNIPYGSKTLTLTQWAKELNMNLNTLKNRICNCHWSVEKAFETPIRKRRKSASRLT